MVQRNDVCRGMLPATVFLQNMYAFDRPDIERGFHRFEELSGNSLLLSLGARDSPGAQFAVSSSAAAERGCDLLRVHTRLVAVLGAYGKENILLEYAAAHRGVDLLHAVEQIGHFGDIVGRGDRAKRNVPYRTEG